MNIVYSFVSNNALYLLITYMNMKAIYIILQDYNKYIIIYINFICVEFHDLYVLSQLVCVILT